ERCFVERGIISTSAKKWYSGREDIPFSICQWNPDYVWVKQDHAVELWTGDSYRNLSADLRPHACAVWLAETDA
ncbi:MAG: hypothetical protein IK087_05525, partial [Lachnospiraceae bacterium]|nr:hypothetical protein [Lachnospiraceae bacterium]